MPSARHIRLLLSALARPMIRSMTAEIAPRRVPSESCRAPHRTGPHVRRGQENACPCWQKWSSSSSGSTLTPTPHRPQESWSTPAPCSLRSRRPTDAGGYAQQLEWPRPRVGMGDRWRRRRRSGAPPRRGRGNGCRAEPSGSTGAPRRRRAGAKSDVIDAERAACDALARTKLAAPKTGPERAALPMLLAGRRSAVGAATTTQRQLRALVSPSRSSCGRFRGHSTPAMIEIASRGAPRCCGRGCRGVYRAVHAARAHGVGRPTRASTHRRPCPPGRPRLGCGPAVRAPPPRAAAPAATDSAASASASADHWYAAADRQHGTCECCISRGPS